MAIDALNLNPNMFALAQTGGVNFGAGKPQKVNPFTQQPVEAPKKAGQGGAIPGTGENIDKQLAFIGQNGMRVNDSEMGVNQPFATYVKGGQAGANLRILS